MTNYTKSTNFATKDTLTSGDPLKIVKGTEINTEFDNIQTAVNSKSDTASPTFTGTVTTATLSVSGTSTLTGVATLTAQPILSSLTISKPVFTDASKGLVSTGTLGADQGGTGVANNVAMTVTGSGNFAYTRTLTGVTNVTFPTTGTLATLSGSETFTNKTLTSPAIGGTPTGVGVLTSGTAVASTSGTSIDFTSIPSWVKRITVMFNGVSLSGTSDIQIQLGVSGTPETTGYTTNYFRAQSTAISVSTSTTDSFIASGGIGIAANLLHGQYVFSFLGSNTWVGTGVFYSSGSTNYIINSAGSKTLAGTLNMVRLKSLNGTDTFDAGSVNILYE
jgi:hypothetical protein